MQYIHVSLAPGESPRCDFCSSPRVLWRYPTQTGQFAEATPVKLITESVGDWSACADCHAIIERGDRPALVQRSCETLGIPMQDACVEYIARIHDLFWAGRIGAPIRVGDGERH